MLEHCNLLSSSKCSFIAGLFPLPPEESSRSSYKFSSVASRFKVLKFCIHDLTLIWHGRQWRYLGFIYPHLGSFGFEQASWPLFCFILFYNIYLVNKKIKVKIQHLLDLVAEVASWYGYIFSSFSKLRNSTTFLPSMSNVPANVFVDWMNLYYFC